MARAEVTTPRAFSSRTAVSRKKGPTHSAAERKRERAALLLVASKRERELVMMEAWWWGEGLLGCLGFWVVGRKGD